MIFRKESLVSNITKINCMAKMFVNKHFCLNYSHVKICLGVMIFYHFKCE